MSKARRTRARRSRQEPGLDKLLTGGIPFGDRAVVRLSRLQDHQAVQEYKWMADPEGEWKPTIDNCASVVAGITLGPRGYTTAIDERWQHGLLQGTARYSLVAIHDGRVIGAIDCSPPHRFMDSVADRGVYDVTTVYSALTAGVCKINAIAVHPTSRGTGVGHALITTASRISRRCGHTVIYGNCKPGVLAFYRKTGFTIYPTGSALDLGDVLPGTAVTCRPGNYLFGQSLH